MEMVNGVDIFLLWILWQPLREVLVPRVYWGTLKNRLKSGNYELYSKCIQLKLSVADGKKYATDCYAQDDIMELVKAIPSK